MRVNINGFPQAEQGGRRLTTNLYLGGFSTPSVGIEPLPYASLVLKRNRGRRAGGRSAEKAGQGSIQI